MSAYTRFLNFPASLDSTMKQFTLLHNELAEKMEEKVFHVPKVSYRLTLYYRPNSFASFPFSFQTKFTLEHYLCYGLPWFQ